MKGTLWVLVVSFLFLCYSSSIDGRSGILTTYYQQIASLNSAITSNFTPPPSNETAANAVANLLLQSAEICRTTVPTIQELIPPAAVAAFNISEFSNQTATRWIPEFLNLWQSYQQSHSAQIMDEFKQKISMQEALWQMSNLSYGPAAEDGLREVGIQIKGCDFALRKYLSFCGGFPSQQSITKAIDKDKANLANCSSPTACMIWQQNLARNQDFLLARMICDQFFDPTAAVIGIADQGEYFLDGLKTAAGLDRGLFIGAEQKITSVRFDLILFKPMAEALQMSFALLVKNGQLLGNVLLAA